MAALAGLSSRQAFFEDVICRMVNYWLEHKALQQLDVAQLDQEREAILKAIRLALELPSAWTATKELISTFTHYMERRGHWESWQQVLNKAITVARQEQDIQAEITLSSLLARLMQRRGQGQEMVRLYQRVIRLARRSSNHFEEARACSNLGYHFIASRNWWRAKTLNCRALYIFEQLKSHHGLAHTHNHLGCLYQAQQNWPLAVQHLQKAIHYWESNQDDHGLIHGYTNLGITYLESEQLAQAIDCFKLVLEKEANAGASWHQPRSLMNLAIALLQDENYQEAEELALKAERLHREAQSQLEMAKTQLVLGEIALAQKNLPKALNWLERALKVFKKKQAFVQHVEVLIVLTIYFTKEGTQPKASIYKRQLESIIAAKKLEDHPLVLRFYQDLTGLQS